MFEPGQLCHVRTNARVFGSILINENGTWEHSPEEFGRTGKTIQFEPLIMIAVTTQKNVFTERTYTFVVTPQAVGWTDHVYLDIDQECR